jgi:membrane protease YdiL (CAAX protease family)
MQNNEEESQSGLKLIVILLFIFALGFLTFMDDKSDIGMNLDNPKTIVILKFLQAIGVLIIFILPSFLFAIFWTKPKIHYLSITTKPALSTLLIAGTGMLMALPMINWLAEINQRMQFPKAFNGIEVWMKHSEEKATLLTDALTKGDTIDVLILNLIVIALMAAFSEELFFRGILQKVLNENTRNKHIGVWVGAILFSAFHMQFYGFLPRMLMGAYLGYLFLWSGSLWPGIFAHFINNGMAVILIWFSNRGDINVDADKVGIQENEWIYVVISFVMVAMSLLFIYRKEKKEMYH